MTHSGDELSYRARHRKQIRNGLIEKLPHACPECNGWVDLERMLCEGCGLVLLARLTVPDVYALLYPGPRIRDVDTFIDDVLSGESS